MYYNFISLFFSAGVSVTLSNIFWTRLIDRKYEKIRLEKISKYDGCIISKIVPINNNSLEELKKNIDYEKINFFISFLKKLKNYTNEDNLKTIYKNLSSLEKEKVKYSSKYYGYYDVKKNEIAYYKDKDFMIGHEFLHAASSHYDKEKGIIYSGLRQGIAGKSNRDASIGIGLNEGYTELLSTRIYNKNNRTGYKNEMKIANLFEFFFDNPKEMEKYYFNYNLPGFINHMEQFATREEIIKLIIEIDNICLNLDPYKIESLIYSVRIQLKLYKWFKAKNKDPEKLKEFEDLLFKNKIVYFIAKKQKYKLSKENLYANNKNKIK